MQRRDFLCAIGCSTLGTLSGCIESRKSDLSLGEEVDASISKFTVEDFRVQQSVVYQGAAHPRLRNGENTQYLIFGVDIVDDDEGIQESVRTRFTLSLGGNTLEELDGRRISTKNQEEFVRDLYLIYPVPKEPTIMDGRLKFSGLDEYTWHIKDVASSSGFTDYINNPPSPRVESLSMPASVRTDADEVAVGVTVSGDSDSTVAFEEPLKLLIGSTKISGSESYTAPIIGGQSTTHNFDVPVYPNQGSSEETIRLNWGRDTISRSLDIGE